MDAIRMSAFRRGWQRLLPGLLLALFTIGASAAPTPPPPPPHPPGETEAPGSRLVVLIINLAADGSVTGVALEKSSGFPKLDAAAMEAAAGWHFDPLQEAGKPVAGKVRVPVSFPPE